MGHLEMAILATQMRAGLARLREFNSFQPDDERALDRVAALLGGFIEDRLTIATVPTSGPSAIASTPAMPENAEDRAARGAFELLRAAHPQHADRMSSLMWMSESGGVHFFKHSNTRRSMTFDTGSGVLSCTLETGETCHDAGQVLREIANL